MEFCTRCGTRTDNTAFCPACGCRRRDGSGEAPYQGRIIDMKPEADEFAQFANTCVREAAPGLYLCGDGKYRWAYELNLWKNPVELVTLIKCLGLTVGVLAVILSAVMLFENGFTAAAVFFLQFSSYGLAGMLGIGLLAYALTALYLGRYCVLNAMDQEGVTVYQFPRQYKKMRVIGWLCVLAGVARGDMAQTMLGLATAAKRMEEIEFNDLSTVTVAPRQDALKLRNGPVFTHVYADKEQFGFVLDFFRQRTSQSVKYKGGRQS